MDRIETRRDGSYEYRVLVTAEGHESHMGVFGGDDDVAMMWAARWRRGDALNLRNFYPFQGENVEAAAKMHAAAGGTITGDLPAFSAMDQAAAMRETMTPGYGNTTEGAFRYNGQREARERFMRAFNAARGQ